MIELLVAMTVAVANSGGVEVRLTNEPCALSAVANMPHRAMWVEDGVTTEGCFTIQEGAVLAYWADRTITAFPIRVFRKARET